MPSTPEPLDRLVVRAGAAVTRFRRRVLAEHGLSTTAFDVLCALAAHGRPAPAQRDLAAEVGVAPATLTAVLDEAERRGDLRRVRDEADRRIVRVTLTARGAARRTAAQAAVDAAVRAVLPGPGPGERATREQLERLVAAVGR
ncbi:MarR family winged helix-turn-helix transcriptional regulator [Pseudonocardia xishanensis]|uniref:HTH marR-type domain-containing protein n=1 Tax=Pseudonocardia xishanensis TaxID=630995 RepID=A0ABP8RU86_9PSEU